MKILHDKFMQYFHRLENVIFRGWGLRCWYNPPGFNAILNVTWMHIMCISQNSIVVADFEVYGHMGRGMCYLYVEVCVERNTHMVCDIHRGNSFAVDDHVQQCGPMRSL